MGFTACVKPFALAIRLRLKFTALLRYVDEDYLTSVFYHLNKTLNVPF